jgi:glycosyltransferase involved in cell wall biosynthesis
LPDIDLRVVVPDRWSEYGTWRHIDVPANPSYAFQKEKVRWPRTPGPVQWHLHYYPRLADTLRSFQPDIIDLWEEAWQLVSVHTCWLRNCILPGAKIVSESEANINRNHPFPFNKFREYTLRNTDYAVARQSEGVSVLRAKGYSGPVEVIGNAVDADIFRPLDRAACKRRLGLAGFVVGYVGRIVESKGLLEIIDALAASVAEVNALFVGVGPYQQELEKRAAALGLKDRVRFLQPRAMEALPEVMNALDVLLLVSRTTPTWKEQFGRVIIEAHACATPVIGSNSGAIPEVVGAGGVIVPERDSAALAAAIERLRGDPLLRTSMGKRGREQVELHYTWQRVAERMRDIYLKLVPARPEAARAVTTR